MEKNFFIVFTSAERWRLCFHLSWFVCLLATLRKNAWMDFHEIFRVSGTWYKEQSGTFLGCSILPLEHRKSFSTFSGESVSVSNTTGKWMNGFSWNLQQRLDMRQYHGKTDEWIFMKFSGYVDYDTRNNLEHFGGDAFNPLDTGFIFLFSGSLFISNIMK